MLDMLGVAFVFLVFIIAGLSLGALTFISATFLSLLGLALSMFAWWKQS